MGASGENAAISFLKQRKYQILDTNIVAGSGEIDLVALDVTQNEVVFVEVKTRRSDAYGSPSLAVGYKKLKTLRQAAISYLRERRLEKSFRFDIISVLPEKIEHFENVTW